MARTNKLDDPDRSMLMDDELGGARDDDLSRVKSVMDQMPPPSFRKMPMPPNPTEPKWKEQFEGLLPKVQANSSSREEFAENLRRVFEAFKKAGYQIDDMDALIQQYLMRWPDSPAPNRMQQDRRNELQRYQDEFDGRGR